MTKAKKVVAILLALVMLSGSFSVLAGAANSVPTPAPKLTVKTEMAVQKGSNWVVTDTVQPGDNVKVYVYVGTDYYSTYADLVLHYDDTFFNHSYSSTGATALTVNSSNTTASSAGIAAYATADATDSGGPGTIMIMLTTTQSTVFQYDDSTYLFELNFTVDPDADDTSVDSDGKGAVYADESDLATEDNIDGLINFPYGDQGDSRRRTLSMYMWTAQTDFTDEGEVTVNNSVDFNIDGVTTTVSGTVGSTQNIPSPVKTGYTFLGWTSSDQNVTAPADTDTTFTMPYEEGVTFTANYVQNVTIHYNTDGGNTIADETVMGGSAWTVHPTPVKAGYKFMGWSGQDVTAQGDLPNTYPAAAGGVTEYTYTANWKKYITITYDAQGGTINGTTTFQGGDAPLLEDLYEGNAWDVNDVTKYNVSNFSNANVTRTGYYLLGWRAGSPTTGAILSTLPATYPADSTTYYAVWEPIAVQVKLYYDETAQIVVNGVADANEISSVMGGTAIETYNSTFGATYTVPSYTIGSDTITQWYMIENGTPVKLDAGDTITLSTDITKLVAVAENTVTVTYDLDGQGEWPSGITGFQYDSATDTYSKEYAIGADLDDAIYNGTYEPVGLNGREFLNWEPVMISVGDDDVVLTATWSEPTSENVYFMDGNTQIAMITVDIGDSIDEPEDPEKEGYTFGGWDYYNLDNNQDKNKTGAFTGSVMPSNPLQADAIWVVNEYKVYYDLNDDQIDAAAFTSQTQANPDTVNYSDAVPAPAAARQGYTGPTWKYYKESTYTTEYTGSTMPAFDLYAQAQWTPVQYTIDFEENGGSTVADITDDYHASIAKPADPTRTGYTFGGWYTDNNTFQNAVTWPVDMPLNGATYYANWTPNTYEVTYVLDGGEFDDATQENPEEITYSETTVLPAPAVSKEGYQFVNWTYSDGTNSYAEGDYMPAHDVTATANWQILSFNVNYNLDGGAFDDANQTNPELVEFAASVPSPAASKTGYTFDGWLYYTDNAYQTAYNASTMPAQDLYAKAQWTPYTFTIDFDSNGGSAVSDIVAAYNANITWPDDPVRDGYTFNGWHVDSASGTSYAAVSTMPLIGANNAVLTLVADWTPIQYTITYTMNGGDFASVPAGFVKDGSDYKYTADFDSAVSKPADPVMEGHTFGGWYTDIGLATPVTWEGLKMPLNGTTFYAKWDVNPYAITYDLNDDATDPASFVNADTVDHPAQVNYGSALPVPAITRDGYTGTWSAKYTDGNNVEHTLDLANDTMPAYPVAYTVTWVADPFAITYDLNDDATDPASFVNADTVDHPATVAYGEALPNPAITRNGYTGVWTATYTDGDDVEHTLTIGTDTMPRFPVRYVVEWTPVDYTITYDLNDDALDAASFDNANDHPATAAYGAALPVPAASRTGYTLTGWNAEYTISGTDYTLDVDNDTMPSANVTYTAIWTKNDYTVSYIVTEFTAPADQFATSSVAYRGAYAAQEPATDPVREGYTFAGWDYYTDSAFQTAYTDSTMPAQNLYAKATWTINKYSIDYVSDDEANVTGMPADLVDAIDYGTAIPAPSSTPDRNNYRFDGWVYTYVDGDNNTQTVDEGDPMPAYNVTATAQWTAKHAVNFLMNIGDNPNAAAAATIMVAEGESIDQAITAAGIVYPEYEAGYTCAGWNTDSTASAAAAIGNMGTTDVDVYAIWTVGQYRYLVRTFTMGTDGQYDETDYTEVSYTDYVDTPVDVTPATVPTGFTADTVKSVYTGVVPAQNDTLILKIYWSRNQYPVAYDTDGGSAVATKQVYFEDSFPEAETAKEGYTFDKWTYFTDANHTAAVTGTTMPAQAVYALANWIVNPYDVTYNFNDDAVEAAAFADATQVNPESVNFGDALPNPVAQRRGYTFDGWTATYVDGNNATQTLDIANDTMPAYAVTYTANWTAYTYAINFDSDGGTAINSITEQYRESITWPANPEKEGYTFVAWHEDSVSGAVYSPVYAMPYLGADGSELDLVAEWRVNPYEITYVFRDNNTDPASFADATQANPQSVNFGEALPNPVAERQGYDFNGWTAKYTDDQNVEHTLAIGTDTMPAYAVTYTASWTAKQYTVTFEENGGSAVGDITDAYHASVAKPADPEKEGYTFDGWYTDDSTFQNAVTWPLEMPLNGINVYAKWNVNSYEITYDLADDELDPASFDDANQANPESVDFGSALPNPAASRTGYELDSVEPWIATYNDGTDDITLDIESDKMPAYPVTYTANWQIKSYTIHYVVEENTSYNEDVDDIVYRTPLADADAIDDPEYLGHDFTGWQYYTASTFSSAYLYGEDYMPAQDIWAKATWDLADFAITYDFNVDDNDPDQASFVSTNPDDYPDELTFGDPLPNPEITRNGYTGTWVATYIDANDEEQTLNLVSDTMPAFDVTYTAEWVPNVYTVNYIVEEYDEPDYEQYSVTYLQAVTAATVPDEYEGYTFDKWVFYTDADFLNAYTGTVDASTGIPASMPATDLYAKATWTVNTYEIHYITDGTVTGMPEDEEVDYGENIPAVTATPVREGYELDETNPWLYYEDALCETPYTGSTMPAKDLYAKANWSILSFGLTYESEGTVTNMPANITVVYNTEIPAAASEPVREGYRFDGWVYSDGTNTYEVGDPMPAAAVTATAQWTVKHAVNFVINIGDTPDAAAAQSILVAEGESIDNAIVAVAYPTYGQGGYNCIGWNTDRDAAAGLATIGNMGTSDVTLYAIWSLDSFRYTVVTYTMTTDGEYDDEHRTIVTDSDKVDTLIDATPASVETGFRYDEDASTATGTVTPDGALELVIYIERLQYNIEYNADGGAPVPATATYYFEQSITDPAQPVKSGYDFDGWTYYTDDTYNTVYAGDIADGMPAQNLYAKAGWTEADFTITYDAAGGTVEGAAAKDVTATFGQVIRGYEPADPVKTGYFFTGWSYSYDDGTGNIIALTANSTVPAADVTATATWVALDIIVRYYVDGEVVDTDSAVYGEAYTVKGFEADGFEVSEWQYSNSSDMYEPGDTYTPGEDDLVAGVIFRANTVDNETYVINFYDDAGNLISTATYNYGDEIVVPADPTKAGATFLYWDHEPGNAAGDDSFYAIFDNTTRTVTFNSDAGVLYEEIEVEYGSTVDMPDDPEKTGYTFLYWEKADGTALSASAVITENITVTAKWDANNHAITYVLNNGENNVTEHYDYGATITTYTGMEKEGYSFDGWFTDEELQTPFTAVTMPDEDLTVYAKWTINSYTVTFNAGDGKFGDDTSVYSYEAEYDSTIVLPPEPTKDGYDFVGWEPDVEGATVSSEAAANVYTAVWTPAEFTVTFYADDAETAVYETINEKFGEAVPEADDPEREGYHFTGWAYTSLDEGGQATGAYTGATMPANDLKAIAQWDPYEFTIDFDSNGGSEVEDITADYEASITWPEDPELEGYSFAAWHVDTVDGEVYAPVTTMPLIGEDGDTLTLVAEWTINQYKITYIPDNDELNSEVQLDYNDEITDLDPEPVKEGYTFGGWVYYTNEGLTDIYIENTMPAQDIWAKAEWSINEYTLTYYAPDEDTEYESYDIIYNDDIDEPEDPVYEGYTFDGWTYYNLDEEGTVVDEFTGNTMPANDLKAVAEWTINQYSIDYVSDDEANVTGMPADLVDDDAIDYKAAIPAPSSTPERDMYRFDGWEYTYVDDNEVTHTIDEGDPMPAYDVRATAQWTAKHTVYFIKNIGDDLDTVITSKVFAEGETISASGVDYPPETNGYTCIGWNLDRTETVNGDLGNMGTADVNVYAIWAAGVRRYEVVTWTMDTTGTYVAADPVAFNGLVDDTVDATPDDADIAEGFYFDAEASNPTGTILEDNSLVLNVYIGRDKPVISYDADGGAEVEDAEVYYEAAVPATETVKEGYTFGGWAYYTDAEHETPYGGDLDEDGMPAQDLYAVAIWTVNPYNVTYIFNDDAVEAAAFADATQANPESVNFGAALPNPAIERRGYTFDGWTATYVDGNDETHALDIANDTMPAYAVTYTANWTAYTYTINFDSNGGSAVESITDQYRESITWPENPELEGYTFVAWHVDSVDGDVYEPVYAMPYLGDNNAELDLVAEWSINSYTVAYDFDVAADDADQPAFAEAAQTNPETIVYNEDLTEPEAVRDGFSFDGWTYYNLDEDGVVVDEYTGNIMPANNLKAVASWTPYTFTIEFNSNGGSDVDDITAAYREDITWPENPELEGYTFDGWHEDTESGAAFEPVSAMPLVGNADGATKTLVAAWTINDYKVTYDLNDDALDPAAFTDETQVNPEYVTYGADLPNPGAERTGYELDPVEPWSATYNDGTDDINLDIESDKMPAYEVTYTANWVKKTFTINYIVDEDPSYNEGIDGIEYRTPLADADAIDDPEIPGYDFYKWDYFTDEDCTVAYTENYMPAYDLYAKATWREGDSTYDINVYVMSNTGVYSVDPDETVEGIDSTTGETVAFDISEYNNGAYDADGFAIDTSMPNVLSADVAPDGSTVLVVYIARNQFTITYDADGGVPAPEAEAFYYEQAITEPTVAKEGYEFSEWVYYTDAEFETPYTGDIADGMPAQNLYALALWTVLDFPIDYVSDDEANVTDMPADTEVTFGDEIPVAGEPSRDMYRFDGWVYTYVDGDDNTQTINEGDPMPAYAVTATAQWTAKHTVYFIKNIGDDLDTVITSKVFAEGEAISVSGVDYPAETNGYTCIGWNLDRTATESGALGDMGTEDVNVYAIWAAGVRTYNVITWTMDTTGTYVKGEPVLKNGLVDDPVDVTPDDADIAEGFYFDAASSNTTGNILEDNSLELNIYIGRYEYDIVYDENSGDAVEDAEVYFEADIPATEDTREGYTFTGWTYFTDAEMTVPYEGDLDDGMPAQDLFAKAGWDINDYAVSGYDFNVDPDDPDQASFVSTNPDDYPDEVTYGDPLPNPEISRNGYTFDGWTVTYVDEENVEHTLDPETDTMPAYPVSYTANWSKSEYTIKYIVAEYTDSDYAEYTLEYLADVTVPADPDEYEGHTFDKWVCYTDIDCLNAYTGEVDEDTGIPATMPATDIYAKATWTVNTYEIHYITDGTVTGMPEDEEVAYGESIPAVNVTPVREGYELDENNPWLYYEDALCETAYEEGTMPAKDLYAKANWSILSFGITYESEGTVTDMPENITVEYNAEIPAAASEPVRDGFRFDGWVYSDGTNTYSEGDAMPAAAVTATAQWTAKHAVNFVINIGDTPDAAAAQPILVAEGESVDDAIADVAYPTYGDGYNCIGWNTDRTAAAAASVGNMGTEDITLYAIWSLDNFNYTVVTYTMTADGEYNDENKTTVTKSALVDTDVDATPETVADGFYLETEHEGYSATGTVTADNGLQLVIYIARSQYDIVYDAVGGTPAPEAATYYFGQAVATPEQPAKEGYNFGGWSYFTDEDKTVAYEGNIADGMPAQNLYAKANWSNGSFTITYDADGGTVEGNATKAVTAVYGEEIGSYDPADPVKEGYFFTGWVYTDGEENTYTASSTMPATDITATATWAALDIIVRYYVGDEVVMTGSAPYGEPYEVASYGDVLEWTRANTEDVYEPGDIYTASETDLTAGVIFIASSIVEPTVTIKFYKDENLTEDNLISSTEYAIGETIVVPAAPEKEGYTFVSWDHEAITATEDDVFYALYTADEQSIGFYLSEEDKQNDNPYAIIDTPYGSTVDMPENPEKEGYTFVNWIDENGNPITEETVITEEFSAVAVWKANKHQITYVLNNGEDNVTEALDYGEEIVPPTVTKEGNDFAGWFKDEDCEEAFTLTTMPDEDLIIYAGWTVLSYNVTFNANEGKFADETDTYSYEDLFGSDIVAPADPVREGYEFSGWDPTVDGATVSSDESENVFTAQWTAIDYTVAYYNDAEAAEADNTYTGLHIGDDISAPTDPVKDGYSFDGWTYYKVDEEGVVGDEFTGDKMPASSLKAVANWTVYTFTIDFDSNGGSDVEDITADYEASITWPANPVKEGNEFVAWHVDSVEGEVYAPVSTMPLIGENGATLKLVAEWRVLSYNISYILNDDDASPADFTADDHPDSVEYSTVIPNPALERDGYTFDGWTVTYTDGDQNQQTLTPGTSTMPAYAVTYTANWLADVVITFYEDADAKEAGTVYATVTVPYGGEVTEDMMPADPEREGAEFDGWDTEVVGQTFTADTEVTGSFTVIDAGITKLMPVSTSSKAMIERNKVVETYNAGILDGSMRLPTRNQLSAIEANEEFYDYPQYAEDAAEYNSWYLYGLRTGLTTSGLAEYVTVTNGGHYVIEGAYRGRIATGTIIKVYDKDDNFVEQFRAVIYGDINGDGNITGTDLQKADNEVVTKTFSSNAGKVETPYLFRAADLNQDGNYTGTDDQRFNEVIPGIRAVDQITGRAETKS